MRTPMSHEDCSAHLRDYVTGDLDPDQARAVADHLAGCSDCRDELRAVNLLAAGEREAMSSDEREHVRAAVIEALGGGAAVLPFERKPLLARLGPALGAAALIAVLAVSFAVSRSSDVAEDSTALPEAVQDQATDGASEGGGAARSKAGQVEAGTDTTANSSATLDAAAPGPQPSADPDAGALEARSLTLLGKRSDLFMGMTGYTTDDAARLAGDFLALLSDGIPAASDQIARCGRSVLDADATALPVYAALGSYRDDAVAVLGFASSPQDTTSLDRFFFWIWPQGTCDAPIDTISGSIRRP